MEIKKVWLIYENGAFEKECESEDHARERAWLIKRNRPKSIVKIVEAIR